MNPRRFIANSAPDALNPSVGIFSARSKRLTVRSVSFATNLACWRRVRFTLNTGPRRNEWARQFRAMNGLMYRKPRRRLLVGTGLMRSVVLRPCFLQFCKDLINVDGLKQEAGHAAALSIERSFHSCDLEETQHRGED